jgi:hypothetical protein
VRSLFIKLLPPGFEGGLALLMLDARGAGSRHR